LNRLTAIRIGWVYGIDHHCGDISSLAGRRMGHDHEVIAALKDRERRHLGWFLGGSFLMTSYNRRYLWIFATCVGVGTAVVAAFNALLLTRHITL
jgi:hypothetical protein